VAFATILAVVAGLTLSGAATLSHDLWVSVVRGDKADQREQLLVARGATVLLAIVSIVLGIAFKGQNVAYMVGLAFAIAASANFPALVLALTWRRFNTTGAVCGVVLGVVSAWPIRASCRSRWASSAASSARSSATSGVPSARSMNSSCVRRPVSGQRRP